MRVAGLPVFHCSRPERLLALFRAARLFSSLAALKSASRLSGGLQWNNGRPATR
ncbi:MAG: hypothetical protein MK554_05880 [Planctomycetes bacterium]|nr:hypothetical protein [Planctomycetota bacterium]